MLALLPLLAGAQGDLGMALLWPVGVSVLASAAVMLAGTRLVPRVLFLLAQTGSRELFLMAIVVIALGLVGALVARTSLLTTLAMLLAGGRCGLLLSLERSWRRWMSSASCWRGLVWPGASSRMISTA